MYIYSRFYDFKSSLSGLVTIAVGTVCNDTSMYFFAGMNLESITKYVNRNTRE